jgi:hypothetical protein
VDPKYLEIEATMVTCVTSDLHQLTIDGVENRRRNGRGRGIS